MYRQYSLLFVFPLLLTISILYIMQDNGKPDASINAKIGDKSYIQKFGDAPDEHIPELIRIRTHLEYAESVLRSRPIGHLSSSQQANRKHYLDLLTEYSNAGKFPHNDGHPDMRRPTFISDDGNICAVGYLVEQTLGPDVAELINATFKYSFIEEINDPVFEKWVEESGFDIHELAMIQPMYGPNIVEEIKVNENRVNPSYGAGSSLITGSNILYLSNRSETPWMFSRSQSIHWFGLAAGTGSLLLGALNLDNRYSYLESTSTDFTNCFNGCPMREITATNHARTAVSATNIGIGLVSVIRSGYHLLSGTAATHEPSRIKITQLNADPFEDSLLIPSLNYSVRF